MEIFPYFQVNLDCSRIMSALTNHMPPQTTLRDTPANSATKSVPKTNYHDVVLSYFNNKQNTVRVAYNEPLSDQKFCS